MSAISEIPSVWEWLKAVLARRFPGLFPRHWQWDEATWQQWEALLQAHPQERRGTAPPPAPRPVVKPQQPAEAPAEAPRPAAAAPRRPRWTARSLAWLVLPLAVMGQTLLNPPRRALLAGLFFYALALALWAWLLWREPDLAPAQDAPAPDPGPVRFRPVLLAVAGVAGAWAFVLFHGNRFTPLNLTLWAVTLLAIFGAFWPTALLGTWRARLRGPWWLRIDRVRLALLAALLVAVFFRGFRLAQVPAEMFSDHAEKLYDVMDVLDGQWRIFFPRNTGREALQMYLTALMARLFGTGISFMSLKLGTFFMGLLMLPYVYLLGRELAGPWVGVAAVLLTGMAYWPNVQARVALRFILYPAFVAPTFYHLLRALRRGDVRDYLWAGFFLGLGLHGYSPFRLVPLAVVLAAGLAMAWNRPQVRARVLQGMSVLVLTAFAVFLPLFRYMLEDPFIFFYRSATRVGQLERPYPGNPVRIFLEESWQALVMPWWDNGDIWAHSVVGHPALSVVDAPLLALGLVTAALAVGKQRRWEPLFLMLSVYVLMLPSILSLAFPIENPSLNRSAGAVVPVFLLAGWGLVTWGRAVGLGQGRRWARLGAAAVLAFFLLLDAGYNYDLVFRKYAESFRQGAWNTSELGRVIGGFARSVGGPEQAWVVPYPYWVDTRLVGINAGFPRRDYALPRERLPETLQVPRPKLFLFKPEDVETEQVLWRLYPQGRLWKYISATPGKDFMVFYVP